MGAIFGALTRLGNTDSVGKEGWVRGEEIFRSDALTFPVTLSTGYCIVGRDRIRTNETAGGEWGPATHLTDSFTLR